MTQQATRERGHRQGLARRATRLVGACSLALAIHAAPVASASDAAQPAPSVALPAAVAGSAPEAAPDRATEVAAEAAPDRATEVAAEAAPDRAAGPAPGPVGLRGRLEQGGWVMGALLGCSLLVVAVAIERAVATRRRLVWPGALRALVDRADGVDRDALRVQVKEPASVGERLVRAGLRAEENGAADATGVVAEIGAREVARLRRGLPLLANLANIATMLGLFGTVLGMIDAFELIAAEGTGDPRIVADGIFKALVTTAAGLAIGIAALALHAMLSARVDGRVRELEDGLGAIFDPAAAPVRPPAHGARAS